ncbi:MAG: Eco57I restriction-modification methylase domain-containing protein [Muribaculaceae bacterium]
MLFDSALKPKLIYVFRINDAAHRGCLKIGEATFPNGANIFDLAPNSAVLNKAARERIIQYTKTAAVEFELLYTEATIFFASGSIRTFNDKQVHEVLLRSGIQRRKGVNWGNEWFETDLATVKNAIAAIKDGRSSLTAAEITTDLSPIEFRPEQREAIDKTLKQFRRGDRMLWNAKMRFGKTLSALQVVKESNFTRTLILTHRPVVDDGWYDDFKKIFYDRSDFRYGSKNRGGSFAELEAAAIKGKLHYVYFASMQDLRGSETVGGKFDKNNEIFTTHWDLIIIDEAHEGTQTEIGQNVIRELQKDGTKQLSLSGTPFNLFDSYKEEELYTWDYVMEQRAKVQWEEDHFGDPNPYAALPAMNIYTYDLGRLLHDYVDEDVAFNFREFFRVNAGGEFIHRADVAAFLDLLCKKDITSAYPFSNETYRNTFRHTLWMVPGVKSALALQRMLESHAVFQHFTVVNVAGEGDPTEEENAEALALLRSKIGKDPDQSRTITLSCGRLTTGVSVPEWTAVLMLSGSYSTAASSYMQTIFRVQTPATINGRVKEQCYVFDFAPDRTLKVLAETAKISTKAGKTSGDDRVTMGEFLNFCPVIGMEGSTMRKFDVDTMLQQLKKVYIERVVSNGFEDGYLYNDELLKLDDLALKEFDDLKRIIGETKAMPKTKQVDVNNQGLTNEEYKELQDLDGKAKKKKDKPELSEEQKRRLEELKAKKKNRETAISILRGISVRMPLMIFGANIDDEKQPITIDNFASLIDPESWEEFMPRGVTKQKFNAFRRYYDPDIFAAAARRIRDMVRSADRLSIEQRIERIAALFHTFRNPDKETVLTPWRVVNMHISDTLGGYCFYDTDFDENRPLTEPRFVDRGKVTAEVFNPDTRILEINSKTGLYPLYAAYSTYRARLASLITSPESIEDEWAVWRQVVAQNIFVVCKTKMAKSITKRTLVGFRNLEINAHAFDDLINQIKNKPANFIEKVVRGRTFWKAINNDNMKFNAVIGNPPYQEEGDNVRKAPLYHLFYNISFQLAPIVTLITPGRFLFKSGQTPKEWMESMLADPHFKVVKYFQKSCEVFSSVDIKGGVAIGFRDESQLYQPIGLYTEFATLRKILAHVVNHPSFTYNEFANLVSSQGIYRFSQEALDKFPSIEAVQGKGTASKITSNCFENLPEIFLESRDSIDGDAIQIMGRINNQRVIRWVKASYIQPCEYLNFYNVFVPEANGTGAIGEVLSTPIIGVPIIGHTDTFLSIGKFSNAQEGMACLKYVKTKFARCMLGTLKATQHNPKNTWANVPMQDFGEGSDIDWGQSVAEIDRQLYAKYKLTDEEIAFIESMIKPM